MDYAERQRRKNAVARFLLGVPVAEFRRAVAAGEITYNDVEETIETAIAIDPRGAAITEWVYPDVLKAAVAEAEEKAMRRKRRNVLKNALQLVRPTTDAQKEKLRLMLATIAEAEKEDTEE
jgi:uncharacterized protein (DUF2225 family)